MVSQSFSHSKNVTDSKFFLEFEGIRQAGEFYLNGKWIGRSENGVMAFGFDITSSLNLGGDNVLAAVIDNNWDYRENATNTKFQWEDRNFYANYGGINKNVYLHTSGLLYQTLPLYRNLGTVGPYIYAQNFDINGKTATVTAELQVTSEYKETKSFTFQADIIDPAGKLLRRFVEVKHPSELARPKLLKFRVPSLA